MEKKVPERKVTLKDDDIIYVYDKRINKCIREDCEGVVKYGLVLKTSITEDETLNCFACNKCHMKYTAYPNYVRITHPDLLHIYNQEEVTARDQKRAEDARKQALRDRRKNNAARKPFAHKPYRRDHDSDSRDHSTQGRKPYEGRRRYEDRKPYGEEHTEAELPIAKIADHMVKGKRTVKESRMVKEKHTAREVHMARKSPTETETIIMIINLMHQKGHFLSVLLSYSGYTPSYT